MIKKVLICIICFVTVCAVLNLKDNLTYEGLSASSEMVKADAQDVRDDVMILGLFGRIITDYSPSAEQKLAIIAGGSQSGMSYTIRYKVTFTGEPGSPVYDEYFGSWDTYSEAEKYVDLLTPMLGDATAPAGNLEYIAFAFSTLVTFVWISAIGLIDTFGVVWSLVKAIFYLLGF